MNVTVTKNVWFFDRIKQSFKNIWGWIGLILVAIVLLYRNEGRSIQTARSLQEVRENVTVVSSESVDNLNEWKLVYTQWMVTTDETLEDMEFGIPNQENLVKLIRTVEMYQREENSETETKDKLWWWQEETTTYTYNKVWSTEIIDSSSFQEINWHENPGVMMVESITKSIKNAKIWAFNLSSDQIAQMNWSEDFSYTEDKTNYISESYKNLVTYANNKVYIWKNWKANPSSPTIWDLRVSRQIVPVDQISLIAEQNWETFRAYQAKAGDSISMLSRWNISSEAMISDAESTNKMMTRLLRVLWVILIISWFKMLFSIIHTLSSVVPFLWRIAKTWVNLVAGVLWFALWILTIAISWIRFRPILWIVLIVISVLSVVWLTLYKKKAKKSDQKIEEKPVEENK